MNIKNMHINFGQTNFILYYNNIKLWYLQHIIQE